MHTTLLLSGTLLALLGATLALARLGRLRGWRRRRDLQLAILAAPTASLGLGLGGIAHFAGRACFLGAPRWDAALAVALPLGMGVVALGGVGLGLLRHLLLRRVVLRRGIPVGAGRAASVARLAADLGIAAPRLLVCAYDRPLALICGLRRPTVLLSTGLVERLDRHELEAVLAHELAHVARRDYGALWLATLLRDAFCYLPTGWAAQRLIRRDQEFACDDLAVAATGRPLALASALAKAWQGAYGGPQRGTAPGLVGAGDPVEARIAHLLAGAAPTVDDACIRRGAALGRGALALLALLCVEAVNLAVMLAPMGCGPTPWLGRLF